MTAVALLTRFQQFGNPILHIDEQFYLLVGDRMLHSALPYVDIWDRKPVGLFLIYAAIRTLGGVGIIQYQLVATGFAIAAAVTVERLATFLSGPRGSMLAGILYLLWIPLLTGQGGQSPVFYNLFVALAALLTLRAAERGRLGLGLYGSAAMLMIGVALQIKYSALFEGIFFGVALLWIGFRNQVDWRRLGLMATIWIGAALLPTVAAAATYAWLGHLREFWFANFVSIGLRGNLDASDDLRNAATLLLYLAPLIILAAHGAKMRWREARTFASDFVSCWLVVALLSVILFGYYFDHYGLPVVVPAAVSAATVLDRRPPRALTSIVMVGALVACLVLPTLNQRRRGTPAQFYRLQTIIAPYTARGLLVWDNLPALYYPHSIALPTRYPFPTHLRDLNEVGAIGIDQPRELSRILDTHPAVVVIELGKPKSILQHTTVMLRQRLTSDYRPIALVKVGRRNQLVYLWKPIPETQ